MKIVEVVALIWDNNKFMICQRPAHKARGLLWEFVGGKVESGETKEQALIRECKEELDVLLSVGDVFMDVVHEYPDLTVHLTLFNAVIAEGEPQKLEHNDIQWITPNEIHNYEFCPADEEILRRIVFESCKKSKRLIESVYPYFKILKEINDNLFLLIDNNFDNAPYDNEELFYRISSDLVRVIPYKIPKKDGIPIFENAKIDDHSGILLLKSDIPFLKPEYTRIIKNEKCLKVFAAIQIIRNKYVHEPHNIHFAFSVGAKTSCSMGFVYKDKIYSINTIWLTNIVWELNTVFLKVRDFCIQEMRQCESNCEEYNCYRFLCDIKWDEYCKQLNRLPWEYIDIDWEFDELIETI